MKKKQCCYLVKFGGSIITDKDADTHQLNYGHLNRIAKVVKASVNKLDYPVILIMGGGSFGNLAPKLYNIDSPLNNWSPLDLAMMTITMQEMLKEIVKIFRENNVPVYPFQSSALFTEKGANIHVNIDPIIDSINIGCVPILTGDLIFTDDGFRIFSSDNLPVSLADNLDVINVLYYGDVPGIYHPFDSKIVVSTVNRDNYSLIEKSAGNSEKPDITGGMKNKLLQSKFLAEKGIDSEILSFEKIDYFVESLRKESHFGTRIVADV